MIGAILALLLGILVLTNKNQKRNARWTLAVIVFLNAHNLLESYLFYNNINWPGLGLSYLHYHLIGALFLLYTYFLFRIEINLKRWIGVLIAFTLFRLLLLAPVGDDVLETTTSFSIGIISLTIDAFLSILLNIGLLTFAFLKIREAHFTVDLTPHEQVNYKWLKNLLIISIGLYAFIFVSNILSLFDEDWLIYFKIESVINSIFSLSLVYATMKFPIFSLHGDFKDLSEESRNKYSKSSLTEDKSNAIWEEINQIMEEEKPYLNFEYRLNDLAERVGKSVHHVSQTINEKEGISFSDFINGFRVRDAKELLRSGRTNQVTIMAVSLEAGFNSKTAFYNTFKKMTGKTPTAFIKENKIS